MSGIFTHDLFGGSPGLGQVAPPAAVPFNPARCTPLHAVRLQYAATRIQRDIAHLQAHGRVSRHLQSKLASIQQFLASCQAAATSAPVPSMPSPVAGVGSYGNY